MLTTQFQDIYAHKVYPSFGLQPPFLSPSTAFPERILHEPPPLSREREQMEARPERRKSDRRWRQRAPVDRKGIKGVEKESVTLIGQRRKVHSKLRIKLYFQADAKYRRSSY